MSDAPRFVVRRLNWRVAGECFIRLPGEVRLVSFGTLEEADADGARREGEIRARLNPFRCGTAWHALTTMPQAVYLDWLQDADLFPPLAFAEPALTGTIPLGEWAEWWLKVAHRLEADQVAHAWAGLNRVRFFEVVERPASAVAFAVVRVMWEYNDSWYEPGSEGGRTVRAFRSRDRAEEECARLEADARREWDGRYWVEARRWELANWPALGEEVGTQCGEAFDRCGVQLYEVVEIDLGEVSP
jgi:hypothetical protein